MREPSYMIILPMDEKDIDNPNIFVENIEKNEHVSIQNASMDEERGFLLDVLVDGKPYSVVINPVNVQVPPYVRPQHAFSDEEYRMIEETKEGVSICMDFDEDNARCFRDQLRIIDAMCPNVLAVLDGPSEKMLLGRWVALAARTETLPSPRYLFTVQAISDDSGEVWLHTHGLKRCGLYELEILCSDKDRFNEHYRIIETFAYRMLESDEGIKPGEAVFIAKADDEYLVCTAVDWKEALTYYPQATLGTAEDRDDEVHDEDTYVIMMYRNPDEEKARKYTPVQEFDEHLQNNPMFMISVDETDRMRRLARERIPFMIKAAQNKDNGVLLKIGLVVDEEYWNEGKPQREHIWFELKEVKENGVVAELTQAPYYVSGMKEGDVGTYLFEDITDWIVFTQKCRVTPDDVYLLD